MKFLNSYLDIKTPTIPLMGHSFVVGVGMSLFLSAAAGAGAGVGAIIDNVTTARLVKNHKK